MLVQTGHARLYPTLPLYRQGMPCLYPTLPSKLIANNFCASTANSIGNWFITSFAKPLMISATAVFCINTTLVAIEDLIFTNF